MSRIAVETDQFANGLEQPLRSGRDCRSGRCTSRTRIDDDGDCDFGPCDRLIVDILVPEGDTVDEDQALIIIET